MMIANKTQAEKIANRGNNADAVNASVLVKSGGKMPCYAIPGKRAAFKWVSVGSSAVIGRGVATSFLARVGVDINEVEAA
jgi:hypothetical protein